MITIKCRYKFINIIIVVQQNACINFIGIDFRVTNFHLFTTYTEFKTINEYFANNFKKMKSIAPQGSTLLYYTTSTDGHITGLKLHAVKYMYFVSKYLIGYSEDLLKFM